MQSERWTPCLVLKENGLPTGTENVTKKKKGTTIRKEERKEEETPEILKRDFMRL
jgi:hypothetical protein